MFNQNYFFLNTSLNQRGVKSLHDHNCSTYWQLEDRRKTERRKADSFEESDVK